MMADIKTNGGKVYVVRKKDTNRIYAMKVLRKSRIISRSEVTHTMAENSASQGQQPIRRSFGISPSKS